jgi:hypothetical protein
MHASRRFKATKHDVPIGAVVGGVTAAEAVAVVADRTAARERE